MKMFEGKVVSTQMNKTVVVEIFRKTPHPMYRKLIKRSKNYNVDSTGFEDVLVGTTVKITETKPISKNKYFKIAEVVGSVARKTSVRKEEVKVVEEIKVEERPVKKTVIRRKK